MGARLKFGNSNGNSFFFFLFSCTDVSLSLSLSLSFFLSLTRVVLEVLKRHRERPDLLGKALQTLASIAGTSKLTDTAVLGENLSHKP